MFMDRNKMTGEPNQENAQFYSFSNFPTTSSIPFIQNMPTHNPFNTFSSPHAVSQPFVPPIHHPQQIGLGSFNFGTDRTFIEQQPVQFPFNVEDDKFLNKQFQRCKRKTDSPPLQRCKQHITEEKMAEHMSNLHISSETAHKPEPETERTKRLYLCEEMRKLQTDSILPQCLLNRLQKPCTALVLWQPPNQILRAPSIENQLNENENNNSQDEPDNNKMENDVIIDFEDMDNVNCMEMDK